MLVVNRTLPPDRSMSTSADCDCADAIPDVVGMTSNHDLTLGASAEFRLAVVLFNVPMWKPEISGGLVSDMVLAALVIDTLDIGTVVIGMVTISNKIGGNFVLDRPEVSGSLRLFSPEVTIAPGPTMEELPGNHPI